MTSVFHDSIEKHLPGFTVEPSQWLHHDQAIVSFKFYAALLKLLEDYDTCKKRIENLRQLSDAAFASQKEKK